MLLKPVCNSGPRSVSFDLLRSGPREGAELNGLSCHEIPPPDPG